MAAQRLSPGLSIGQLLTLTLGFLVASVLIFALGWWVGFEAAEERFQRERRPIRMAVPPPAVAIDTPAATAAPPTAPPRAQAATPTPTPTPTRVTPPSPTPPAAPPRTATPAEKVGALKETFAVQVKATTEALEAVMFARQLRQKGYDAYTVQGPVGGINWYRVRVGRFTDRNAAKQMERRLKEQEGLEAAYVVQQ